MSEIPELIQFEAIDDGRVVQMQVIDGEGGRTYQFGLDELDGLMDVVDAAMKAREAGAPKDMPE